MAVDYDRLMRVLVRCEQVAQDRGVKPIVKRVYDERLSAVASTYRDAYDALPIAASTKNRERAEAKEQLAGLDQPYREARATYLAYAPSAVIPETLKSLVTDTDKVRAVQTLLDRIDDHVGSGWADDLLAGPFGQNAPRCVDEVNQATAADTEYDAAQKARAAAHGPAYEMYLAFKNVVRNAHGPSSAFYRRIHLRADGRMADEVVPGAAAEP